MWEDRNEETLSVVCREDVGYLQAGHGRARARAAAAKRIRFSAAAAESADDPAQIAAMPQSPDARRGFLFVILWP